MNQKRTLALGIAIGIAITVITIVGCAAAFSSNTQANNSATDGQQTLCLPGYNGGQPTVATVSEVSMLTGIYPVYIFWPTSWYGSAEPGNYHLKVFNASDFKTGVDYKLADCK